jgi:hypothetical protein
MGGVTARKLVCQTHDSCEFKLYVGTPRFGKRSRRSRKEEGVFAEVITLQIATVFLSENSMYF